MGGICEMEIAVGSDPGFAGDRVDCSLLTEHFVPAKVIDRDSVDVYGIKLDTHSDGIASFEAVLSADERRDIGRLMLHRDRRRITISRGALRIVLGGYLEQ